MLTGLAAFRTNGSDLGFVFAKGLHIIKGCTYFAILTGITYFTRYRTVVLNLFCSIALLLIRFHFFAKLFIRASPRCNHLLTGVAITKWRPQKRLQNYVIIILSITYDIIRNTNIL